MQTDIVPRSSGFQPKGIPLIRQRHESIVYIFTRQDEETIYVTRVRRHRTGITPETEIANGRNKGENVLFEESIDIESANLRRAIGPERRTRRRV